VSSNSVKFSDFFNSVITTRIVEELELNINEPYIEISLISENSTFVAKKAKTFEEERNVAEKAPVDGIQISDLNKTANKAEQKKDRKFSYSIKIADFYYEDSARNMIDRIKSETSFNNPKIIKLSQTKFRVLLGPFNDIKTLQKIFNEIKSLDFENLEILRNA
jgi:cell division septation protein DedD